MRKLPTAEETQALLKKFANKSSKANTKRFVAELDQNGTVIVLRLSLHSGKLAIVCHNWEEIVEAIRTLERSAK